MIRLRSLGESVIEVGDGRVGPESEVLFGALLYLLVARGRRIPRSVLFELFWPGREEQARQHCARQLLYRLRQLGVPLEGNTAGVAISGLDGELDYERLLGSDDPSGEFGPVAMVFLPGYAPGLSVRYDEWIEEHREHVHARLRKALLRRIAAARSEGRWADVEQLARQCLSCDPLNEEATLALAEATALGGGKTQALAIIDRYLRELGSDSRDIRVPATVLRRRIVDHLPGPSLSGTTETQFVGRDASVAMLTELLQSARSGEGRACVIEGAPGIGKSRLAAEFSAAASLKGLNVRRVTCQESDRERPLSAFADLVPTLLSLRGAAGCAPESLGFLRRLTDLDTKAPHPSEAAREAEFLAAQIRQSLFDLLDAVAAERCLLLVVDNAHRLDPVSWKVFREMFEWVRTRQVLVLLTMRHVPDGALGDAALDGTVVRHRLGPLSDVDSSSVFTTFIARHGTAVLEDHRAWCVRVAEGSPFYLRELASHWLTTRETESLPASLSALIDARLSGLRQPALRVLQTCAVLGKNATCDRVQRILEYPRHELVEAFDELERGGFLVTGSDALDVRHDLLSTCSLDRLSATARLMIHEGAGEVLEADADASKSPGLLWDCAQHWYLAGKHARAVAVARRCARYLIEVGLPLQAAEILERATTFESSSEDAAAILRERIHALRLAGQWKRIWHLTKALERIRNDAEAEAALEVETSVLLEAAWRNAHPLPELLGIASQLAGDRAQEVQVRAEAAVMALVFADNMFAEQIANDVYSNFPDLNELGADKALLRAGDMIFHCSFGDISLSVAAGNALVKLQRGSAPISLCRSLRHAGVALCRAGLLNEASVMLNEAFELANRYSLATATNAAAVALGNLSLICGDLFKAEHWCSQAFERIPVVEDTVCVTSSINCRVRLLLAQGDVEGAEKLFARLAADARTCESIRALTSARGIALCIRYQQGHLTSDDELLEEVSARHQRNQRFGGHDFTAVTLYRSLQCVGRPREAEELLSQYVACRRERFPLSLHLVHSV